jgi:hypothetical protein
VILGSHNVKIRSIILFIKKDISYDDAAVLFTGANARLAVFVGTAGADFLFYRLSRQVLCVRKLGANLDWVSDAWSARGSINQTKRRLVCRRSKRLCNAWFPVRHRRSIEKLLAIRKLLQHEDLRPP